MEGKEHQMYQTITVSFRDLIVHFCCTMAETSATKVYVVWNLHSILSKKQSILIDSVKRSLPQKNAECREQITVICIIFPANHCHNNQCSRSSRRHSCHKWGSTILPMGPILLKFHGTGVVRPFQPTTLKVIHCILIFWQSVELTPWTFRFTTISFFVLHICTASFLATISFVKTCRFMREPSGYFETFLDLDPFLAFWRCCPFEISIHFILQHLKCIHLPGTHRNHFRRLPWGCYLPPVLSTGRLMFNNDSADLKDAFIAGMWVWIEPFPWSLRNEVIFIRSAHLFSCVSRLSKPLQMSLHLD